MIGAGEEDAEDLLGEDDDVRMGGAMADADEEAGKEAHQEKAEAEEGANDQDRMQEDNDPVQGEIENDDCRVFAARGSAEGKAVFKSPEEFKAKLDELLIYSQPSADGDVTENAEQRAKQLQERLSQRDNQNPMTTQLLAFTQGVIKSVQEAKDVVSKITRMNNLVFDLDTTSLDDQGQQGLLDEQRTLRDGLAVCLGFKPGEECPFDIGDLFIRVAFKKGLGWNAVGQKETIKAPTKDPNPLCGLKMAHVLSVSKHNEHLEELVPATGNPGAPKRDARDAFIAGTSVVVVHALARKILHDKVLRYKGGVDKEGEYNLQLPIPKKQACLLAGYWFDGMRNTKGETNAHWFKAIGYTKDRSAKNKYVRLVEHFPTLETLEARVEYAIDKYLEEKKKNPDSKIYKLSVRHASTWAEDGNLGNVRNNLPKKSAAGRGGAKGSTRTDSKEDDKNVEDERRDEDYVMSQKAPDDQDLRHILSTKPNEYEVGSLDTSGFRYTTDGRDDGAHVLLNRIVQKQYLCGNAIPTTLPEASRPKIEYHFLDGINPPRLERRPEVIVVRNALSEDFAKAIRAMYFLDLPFCRGAGRYF